MGIIPMNTKAEVADKYEEFNFHSSSFEMILKRIFDVTFSFLVIVAIWPLLLVIALLVKLTSKGPILFKQKRNGLQGDVCLLYTSPSPRD